ncbi:hypothetical protein F7725_016398 [Dissostichus mawsoni]|uniref:Endoplasmic reticulum-Golgi intermediate compartment protein n=1 Tax=Dissostichus mawsoni TaxID=36200 RepID=A0A7J5Z1H7_DISMA|nr:hypothetical protein F7725_016398 [Dissostichus mawsoni]
MYQYFVKIVPTIYVKTDGEVVKTNQFSVTRHEKVANGLIGDQGLPGVFVLYELSPMMIVHTLFNRSVCHYWRSIYSCRIDRFAHLPLSSSHPEEDRVGKSLLTAPPAGLHGEKKKQTEKKGQRETERF